MLSITVCHSMNIETIIDKIELAYNLYLQQGSEIMFNTFTDHFFDKLESVPSCEKIRANFNILSMIGN